MANKKEKIFVLMYETNDRPKLHKFIDELCDFKKGGDNKKYLHWAHYNGFYTLSTLENTYWDVNKLSEAIYKHMEHNIRHIIFEVQDSPAQGRMPDKYWKFWKESQDLTGTYANYTRAKKLKKITEYINKKKELQRREEEIKRRKRELEKAISLKKREDEIKAQELEIEELEKELHDEPDTIVETPTKKRKRWSWRS
jgi:hypothetical protein